MFLGRPFADRWPFANGPRPAFPAGFAGAASSPLVDGDFGANEPLLRPTASDGASLTLIGVMAVLLAVVSASQDLPWTALTHRPACLAQRTRPGGAAALFAGNTGGPMFFGECARAGLWCWPVASAWPVAFPLAARIRP